MGTNYSGLVVAAIGFFLTRFTVTLAVYNDPVRFYFAGVVPLVLGLGLAAFGVALAIGDVDPAMGRTTARWCVIGTLAMAVLVVLTLLGASAGEMPDLTAVRSRTYLANFLIGGSVGGTFTGLYAARNRGQRRALRQQTNRLEVLNRLLRHEVLNSLTAIRGYASIHDDQPDRAREVIDSQSSAIGETIEEVKYLTDTAGTGAVSGTPVDLGQCLEASAASVRERYPDATVELDEGAHGLAVRANERVERVFEHLLENAIVYGDENRVEVSVSATESDVRVSVADDGPGLPAEQRALLERGDIGEFDNPKAGFGLNVVRLLVESYRGSIETAVTAEGTTVTVVLPRATRARTGLAPNSVDLASADASPVQLAVTVGAALAAGVVMGAAAELLTGTIPVIGALYGVESAVVGWIAHEFHSVVFGFVFAGLVSLSPRAARESVRGLVALGAAWGLVLSILAAGVVMPIWLRLVAIPAPVPNVTPASVSVHLLWGATLGLLTAVGFAHVVPRLSAREIPRVVEF